MQPGFTRYVSYGHRQVEGWLEPPILRVLARLAREQERAGVVGSMAEIGVHHGRFFIAMHLLRTAGEKSLAIDAFDDESRAVAPSPRQGFVAALTAHIGGLDDVLIRPADSSTLEGIDVLAEVGPVRMFSLAGGNTADSVAHDLRTAAAALADGGVIFSGHTFDPDWPGVAEGTYRFLAGQARVVPFGIGFNKVMLTTPDHADRYRIALRSVARRRDLRAKETEMAGAPVIVLRRTKLRDRPRVAANRLLRRG